MALVYIAASLSQVDVARQIARIVRLLGHVPVSSWHDTVERGAVDPENAEDRRAIATTCVHEILGADFMVAYTAGGHPCGTFTEIGIAVGRMKPVVWCMPPGRRTHDNVRRTNVFDSLGLVRKVTSSELLEAAIEKVAGAFA